MDPTELHDPTRLVETVIGLNDDQRERFLYTLSRAERVLLDGLVDDHLAKSKALVSPPAAAYLHDPVGWVDKFTDLTLTGYQTEVLHELEEYRRLAVRGPHGLGKSFVASVAVAWFSTTAEAAGLSWKIGTTASVWRQLTKFLWPEIRALTKHFDWAAMGMTPWVRHEHLLDLSIKLDHGEAFAAASDVPENLEGLHGRRVLYVYDEAKKIPAATWEATEGAFSTAGADTEDDAYALAVSTPGPPMGTFYDIHKRKPAFTDWHAKHVTLVEAVGAGRVSQEWADKRKLQWGENSPVYRTRVLGEFAADDEKSLIPLSWVEAAVERWHAWVEAGGQVEGGLRVGVDVARHGSDQTVLAFKHGPVVTKLEREAHTDNVVDLADRVAQLIGVYGSAVVDADGMGAGTADQLRRVVGDGRVTVFHGAPRPEEWSDRSGELRAFNTRAAAWYNMRELLDPAFDPTVCLPEDDELLGDLTAPERVYDGRELIKLESKAQTKSRLGRSPDGGDAVVMAFWVPPAPLPPPQEFTSSPEWASKGGQDWGARP